MARTAKVTVVIDDNGTMRLAEKDAKKLGASLEKTGKSLQSAQRGLRGTAQMSSNSTKNFAKQSQVMNGVLVPAYATLAAQVFALTAVFRFFQSAADLRVLNEGQLAYAKSTGVALSSITASLQEATQGQLAFREAAQAASIGVAAGLDASQLRRLSVVATQASAALGRDLTDSFNRLVKGAIKAEPELLDELGIIVRLQEASENYGRKIGKTANELSTFEKSQAVVNAVLEQGEDKFGKFEIKVNRVNQAGKAFNDLLISLQTKLAPFIELLSKAVSESGLFAAAIAGFAFAGPIRSLVPDAREFADFNRQDIGRSMVGAGLVGDRDGQLQPFLDGTFTTSNLRQIEKALEDTNSKIVDNSATAQTAVRGLAIQARASILHEAGVMEKGMKGFFKRMEAQFISARGTSTNFFSSVRAAGTVAFTAIGGAVATAFNIVAIAGLIYTLGQLVFTYFKSTNANEAFNERLNNTTESLKKQREEIENIGKSLNDSGLSGSGGLSAISNFLRSQDYSGGLKVGEQLVSQKDIDSIEEATKKLEEFRQKTAQLAKVPQARGMRGQTAQLANAFIEEGLKKQIGLTKEQRGVVENLSESLKSNAQFLRESGAKDLPIVSNAVKELTETHTKLEEILSKEVQTEQDLLDLKAIYAKIRREGVGSLGEASKFLAEFQPVIESGVSAADEFYKTITEGANELSKDDAFKGLRSNLVDSIAALEKEIEAQAPALGEKTQKMVSTILGFDVKAGPSLLDPKIYLAQLQEVKAGYDAFYRTQLSNEKERLRINTDLSALFRGTFNDKEAKIFLQTDMKILDTEEKIQETRIKLNNLEKLGGTANAEQIAILTARIAQLNKSLGIISDEANFQLSMLDTEKERFALRIKNSKETTALKVKELGIDRSIAGHEAKIADIKAMQASSTEEQARTALKIAEGADKLTATYESDLANAQNALDLAMARTDQVNMQNNAMFRQLKLQEDLGRIQTKNLQLEGSRLDRQLGSQDTVLGRIRSAGLDAEGFRNQAESKRREAQEQNLKQFEKDNLLLEADNLEKRAQVAVFQASIQAEAAQGLINTTREGLTDVISTAIAGDSVTDAALRFVSSFATSLQDSMTNALISSFMDASNLEVHMKSFADKFMSFLFPQAGGAAGGILNSIIGGIGSLFGGPMGGAMPARYGGVLSARNGFYDKMYSGGGIAKGRDSGYPAILHGTEAVVPLPDGKKIPVQMQGTNSNVNSIAINVSIDQSGNATSNQSNASSDARGRQFGEVLSKIVQEELLIQTREGGLLNR